MSRNEQWYMVIDAADGRAVSIGTDVADPLPEGLEAIPISGDSASAILCSEAVWDTETRAVVVPTPPVPTRVEAHKLRRWLIEHDHDPDAVSAAIQQMPDVKQRRLALNDWEYATSYQRRHPLMPAFLQVTGLSDEQADQAFREASRYE